MPKPQQAGEKSLLGTGRSGFEAGRAPFLLWDLWVRCPLFPRPLPPLLRKAAAWSRRESALRDAGLCGMSATRGSAASFVLLLHQRWAPQAQGWVGWRPGPGASGKLRPLLFPTQSSRRSSWTPVSAAVSVRNCRALELRMQPQPANPGAAGHGRDSASPGSGPSSQHPVPHGSVVRPSELQGGGALGSG